MVSPAGPTSLQDVTIKCSDASAAMHPATVSPQGPSLFAPLRHGPGRVDAHPVLRLAA